MNKCYYLYYFLSNNKTRGQSNLAKAAWMHHTVEPCDRQTDGQTDTTNIGKNSLHLTHLMQPENETTRFQWISPTSQECKRGQYSTVQQHQRQQEIKLSQRSAQTCAWPFFAAMTLTLAPGCWNRIGTSIFSRRISTQKMKLLGQAIHKVQFK